MTEDEMKEFLKENSEAIKLAVRDKLMTSILQEYRWNFSDAIGTAVNEWIKTEIVPEVKDFLTGEKGAIVQAAQEGARQIGNVLTEQMVKKATENLTGYGMGDVLTKMFRGY